MGMLSRSTAIENSISPVLTSRLLISTLTVGRTPDAV